MFRLHLSGALLRSAIKCLFEIAVIIGYVHSEYAKQFFIMLQFQLYNLLGGILVEGTT